MKFANVQSRLFLVNDDGKTGGLQGVDVARASGDKLPSDPAAALWRWADVIEWATGYEGPLDVAVPQDQLGPPSPAPAQIFAVGVNYADHLAEAGWDAPELPMVFPKLLPAISGPFGDVVLSAEDIDWEIEVVAVIGKPARKVVATDAWDYVAGLTAGQDFSARVIQMRPRERPQFSLGKSLPGFAPIGPVIVTPDGFSDRENIELSCSVNGAEMQRSRTKHLVFSVARLVEYLSEVTTLLPGDLIFTGTPGGVGAAMSPPRFLGEDDVVDSHVEGIGSMSHRFVPERADEGHVNPRIPNLAKLG